MESKRKLCENSTEADGRNRIIQIGIVAGIY